MPSATPVPLGQRPSQERITSWVRAAAAGDRSAVGPLFEVHHEPLMNWLYRITRGDKHLSDEIAGQVWESVFEGIKGFDPDRTPFSAWLKVVARNKLRDSFRRATTRRRAEIAAHLTVGGGVEEYEPSPEAIVEVRQGARDAMDVLRRLTPRQAAVIALVDFDGLSTAEAALELGIKENTAKVTRHRALTVLRAEQTLRGSASTRRVPGTMLHTDRMRRAGSTSAKVTS